MEMTEKEENVMSILRNKKISAYCIWLLKAHSALSDVPSVESVEQKDGQYCKFSYKGKSYGLFYEQPSTPYPSKKHYDLRISVNSEDVLKIAGISLSQNRDINSGSLEKAKLDTWLEIIPQIAANAQEIDKKQKQQQKDANIDLGKYG